MSAKQKKKVPLPKYGLGGDILNTGLNLWGDFTGLGGITDSIVNNIDPDHKDPVIENKFLQGVNRFSDNVLSPISRTIAPIALNMVAPGAGSLLGGVQAGADALNPELNGTQNQATASTAPKQLLNVDSRYIHRANGGPIINEMPMGNYGTDQIPTDQTGMPSKQTGRKPIAFTDAGELTWNGYVFSKDLGFADKAKKIANRYKFRLGDKFDKGDRYSEEALERELTKLAQEQEQVRPKDMTNEMRGDIPMFQGGGSIPNLDYLLRQQQKEIGWAATYAAGMHGGQPYRPRYMNKVWEQTTPTNIPLTDPNLISGQSKPTHITLGNPPIGYMNDPTYGDDGLTWQPPQEWTQGSVKSNPFNQPVNTNNNVRQELNPADYGNTPTLAGVNNVTPSSRSNSNFFGDNSALLLGGVAQAIPLIARGINLANNKPEVVNTPKYTPQDIDLSAQREDLQRRATGAKQTAIRNSRYNPAAQLAGVTAYDEQLASGLGESWMNQETANTREHNRAGMFNTQITQQDNEMTARERGAYQMQVDTLWGDVANAGVGLINDAQRTDIQRKVLASMKTRNMSINPETFAVEFQKYMDSIIKSK